MNSPKPKKTTTAGQAGKNSCKNCSISQQTFSDTSSIWNLTDFRIEWTKSWCCLKQFCNMVQDYPTIERPPHPAKLVLLKNLYDKNSQSVLLEQLMSPFPIFKQMQNLFLVPAASACISLLIHLCISEGIILDLGNIICLWNIYWSHKLKLRPH